jgi:regulator of protease activity HflC (stomatin/prohibitin superfamily)
MENRSTAIGRAVLLFLVVIVALVVVFSSYTVISPGNRGVVVMLGRVEDLVLVEGFHLVLPPVVRQVIQLDVRTKKLEMNVEAASSDLQVMRVTGVLNYHVDPMEVNRLYREVGMSYEEIIIVPAMQEAIKAATAQFRIERVLIERAVLKDTIQQTLAERLGRNQIIVDQFTLADVEFTEEFNRAIERKQVAEQAALQKQYELQAAEKDVEIALALAEGERKAAVIAAEGRAEARRIEAEVEAEALGLIAARLTNNPELIRYEWATRLSPGVKTVLLPSGQDFILDTGMLLAE